MEAVGKITKHEFCICGKDIAGIYLAHPPLWHFYDLRDNNHPDNEPWSELEGLTQAVMAVGQGSMTPEKMV